MENVFFSNFEKMFFATEALLTDLPRKRSAVSKRYGRVLRDRHWGGGAREKIMRRNFNLAASTWPSDVSVLNTAFLSEFEVNAVLYNKSFLINELSVRALDF